MKVFNKFCLFVGKVIVITGAMLSVYYLIGGFYNLLLPVVTALVTFLFNHMVLTFVVIAVACGVAIGITMFYEDGGFKRLRKRISYYRR